MASIEETSNQRFYDVLCSDIQWFTLHANRLRQTLNSSSNVSSDGSLCVAVHSSLSLVSQSMRNLLTRYPIFKTAEVLIPGSQLINSIKELNFDSSNIDASQALASLDKLETAIDGNIRHLMKRSMTVTDKMSSTSFRNETPTVYDNLKCGRLLLRRHSAYEQKLRQTEFNISKMDRILAERVDGIDIAFDRAKAWTKYCKDLVNYASRRMNLEMEHAKRVQNLANQSKFAINEQFLPLADIFGSNFSNDIAFVERTSEAVNHIQDRFIKSLETRRDQHERQRRNLKSEWVRMVKQVKDTWQELLRARALLESRDEGYRKAQENSIKTESSGPAVGSELLKRRKEMEKRRKNEEEALTKLDEAKTHLQKLQVELDGRQHQMNEVKVRMVEQLRELIYQCDQTTKACSTHYFQALANLWISQPDKYHELADATRAYIPGSSYMSFLHSLPKRTISYSSLLRNHQLQRVRQPAKCAHCEALSILSTVHCTHCGLSWHKSCLSRVSLSCGRKEISTHLSRRASIFGVAISSCLTHQDTNVPEIIEKCIAQLEKRGMKTKGIYRTCGVKSKIEQICQEFERLGHDGEINLEIYHPMNIASVVKLYLRKLPEPLLTLELYDEWIALAVKFFTNEIPCAIDEVRALMSKLPEKNFETLKFILLHLNRVTCFINFMFEIDNLMTASNLGAVISPSLIWMPYQHNDQSSLNDAHLMGKVVELLIKHAFDLFDADRMKDWQQFIERYSKNDVSTAIDQEIEANFSESEVMDDEELLEDDTDTNCSLVVPLPPTPDLLKNTSRKKSNSRSVSDDIDNENYVEFMNETGAVSGDLINSSPQCTYEARGGFAADVELKTYATSILVTPDPNIECILTDCHPHISETKSYSQESAGFSLHETDSKRTNQKSGSAREQIGIFRHFSQGANDVVNQQSSSDEDCARICLQSTGILFSASSDVSYV